MNTPKDNEKGGSNKLAWALLIFCGGTSLTISLIHALGKLGPDEPFAQFIGAVLVGVAPAVTSALLAHMVSDPRTALWLKGIVGLVFVGAMIVSVDAQADMCVRFLNPDIKYLLPIVLDLATVAGLLYLAGIGRKEPAETSLATVSEPPVGKISEPVGVAPVNLAPASLAASLATPSEPPTGPSLNPASEPLTGGSPARVSEPPVTLTGEVLSEPSEPPASEASEAELVNSSAPVSEPASEPPVKPVRKPARPAAKTAKARQAASSGKIDITAMNDSDLLELLARDFAADELSANKIRLRYSIGTDKAKVIYDRWRTLTDITDEQLAAVGE